MTRVDGVRAAAYARLARGKPWTEFVGRLLDTPQAPYGSWRWGDRISAGYRKQFYSCLVRNVRVGVDAGSEEAVDTRLEYIG